MSEFISVKERVQYIIQNNTKEVTSTTSFKTNGVYMLYVDCFDDDKIIPFYIGETKNFQRRHKEHITQIMSLNRLSKYHYKQYLLNDFYFGYYKACKIFSYMVNHKCTFKNLHMIILEEFAEDATGKYIKRKELENKYIEDLKAQFYGFNQLTFISDSFTVDINKKLARQELLEMFNRIEYGYGLFNMFTNYNYMTTFANKINDFNDLIVSRWKYIQLFYEITKEYQNANNYILVQPIELKRIINDDVSRYFFEKKLESEEKRKMIYDILLFDKDDREFNAYIDRYAKGNTENIIQLLKVKYLKKIEELKRKIQIYKEKKEVLQNEYNLLLELLFDQLIPNAEYYLYPLKDGYSNYVFNEIDEDIDNVLYINIEYSCFKSDCNKDIYPEILKIDYLYLKDGYSINEERFIKTSLKKIWLDTDCYYYEKDFDNIYNLYQKPFNLGLSGEIHTIIPILMEYRNNINESTLKDRELVDLVTAFKEIDQLIDNKTKIVYSTSSYKSSIKRYKDNQDIKDTLILKKLIRACK